MGKLAEPQAALSEHVQRVWQRGWVVIVSGIGGVLGLISLIVPPSNHSHPGHLISPWIWVPLLAGGLVVAQFLAFLDVRSEREEARSELRTRLNALRFGLQMGSIAADMARAPDGSLGVAYWLTLLNGSPEPIEWEIESVSIVLDGHTEGAVGGGRGLIMAGREGQFEYPFIAYQPAPGHVAEGVCEYAIRYRHPSGAAPSFRIRQRLGLELVREGEKTSSRWRGLEAIRHETIEESE